MGMLASGMLHPLVLAPFYFYQAAYLRAVLDFNSNDASVQSAKQLKRKSYMPFIVLLAGFVLSTAYSRREKRAQNLELQEPIAAVHGN